MLASSVNEIERWCVSGFEHDRNGAKRLRPRRRRVAAACLIWAASLVLWVSPAMAQTTGAAQPGAASSGVREETLSERAERLKRGGRLDDADRALTTLLADEPENAAHWFSRGEVRALQGRHIHAAADFSAALRYAPQNARAFAARSEQLRLLGALPRAIEDATAAIGIDPRFAQAYAARAYALQRLGRNAEALRDAESALQLDGSTALALLARGLARERPDPAAARRDIERAVELGLQSPVATAALQRLSGTTRR
ncbi:MAG: tetratricopeptide repeat protein [Hyphomicrobiales bacterium]|nr:tetratricopeptide repeat protein [Hyphomicrobiales bacterium]